MVYPNYGFLEHPLYKEYDYLDIDYKHAHVRVEIPTYYGPIQVVLVGNPRRMFFQLMTDIIGSTDEKAGPLLFLSGYVEQMGKKTWTLAGERVRIQVVKDQLDPAHVEITEGHQREANFIGRWLIDWLEQNGDLYFDHIESLEAISKSIDIDEDL